MNKKLSAINITNMLMIDHDQWKCGCEVNAIVALSAISKIPLAFFSIKF